jgi:hypothetical protein
MSEHTEDDAIKNINRLAAKWADLVDYTAAHLPPEEVGYFEQHAPYLDLRPLKAFLKASDRLSEVFQEVQANTERFAWDSNYEEEVFEKIYDASRRVREAKCGMDRYTEIWMNIEISKDYIEAVATEVIERAKNGPPLSPA